MTDGEGRDDGDPGAEHRLGVLRVGDVVQLTDTKGRRNMLVLEAGRSFHTHRGSISHDELLGGPEGVVVKSTAGEEYLVFRPSLADYTVRMSRGAAVVYPKDAAQLLAVADVFPGATVVEAGAGSGALSCWLLRVVGDHGRLYSYEQRADFAEIARKNVHRYLGGPPTAWQLTVGELTEHLPAHPPGSVDRVVLDMLAPWQCLGAAATALVPGGVLCAYVATTTQLSTVVEALRESGQFDEPAASETMVRGWHVDGLAVRPDHRMVGHTGFLVGARRLAPGVSAPPRKRRPAKGARQGQGTPRTDTGEGGS